LISTRSATTLDKLSSGELWLLSRKQRYGDWRFALSLLPLNPALGQEIPDSYKGSVQPFCTTTLIELSSLLKVRVVF
jgi:hypothetical protein